MQHLGVIFALAPSHISLPRYPCRVGLHVGFFEACSAFTHVAACTRARSPSRDRYPEASDISSPPCLLRLLPAGADAGWDLHPLENAALHGARDTQPPIPTFASGCDLTSTSAFRAKCSLPPSILPVTLPREPKPLAVVRFDASSVIPAFYDNPGAQRSHLIPHSHGWSRLVTADPAIDVNERDIALSHVWHRLNRKIAAGATI